MHVILDDLRAEDRVGKWERVQEAQVGARVDGRRLRFDVDATETRREGVYLSLPLPVCLSASLPTTSLPYITVAQTRTKLQGTGAGTGTDRHIAPHT